MLGQIGQRQLAALLACLALAGCSDPLSEEGGSAGPGRTASARVTRHTDGDTLWLSGIGGAAHRCGHARGLGEDECLRRLASAFVERTAPLGTRVRYRLGVEERDRHGRALAYVWLQSGGFLNRLLLARGYAQPLTIPPNVEYADQSRGWRVTRATLGADCRDGPAWGSAPVGCPSVVRHVITPSGVISPVRCPKRAAARDGARGGSARWGSRCCARCSRTARSSPSTGAAAATPATVTGPT